MINNLKTRIAMKANIVIFFYLCWNDHIFVMTAPLIQNIFFWKTLFFCSSVGKKWINGSSSWNSVNISYFRNQVLRFIRSVETRSQNTLSSFYSHGNEIECAHQYILHSPYRYNGKMTLLDRIRSINGRMSENRPELSRKWRISGKQF